MLGVKVKGSWEAHWEQIGHQGGMPGPLKMDTFESVHVGGWPKPNLDDHVGLFGLPLGTKFSTFGACLGPSTWNLLKRPCWGLHNHDPNCVRTCQPTKHDPNGAVMIHDHNPSQSQIRIPIGVLATSLSPDTPSSHVEVPSAHAGPAAGSLKLKKESNGEITLTPLTTSSPVEAIVQGDSLLKAKEKAEDSDADLDSFAKAAIAALDNRNTKKKAEEKEKTKGKRAAAKAAAAQKKGAKAKGKAAAARAGSAGKVVERGAKAELHEQLLKRPAAQDRPKPCYKKPTTHNGGKIYWSQAKGALRVYKRSPEDKVEETVKVESENKKHRAEKWNIACALIESDPRPVRDATD